MKGLSGVLAAASENFVAGGQAAAFDIGPRVRARLEDPVDVKFYVASPRRVRMVEKLPICRIRISLSIQRVYPGAYVIGGSHLDGPDVC